MFKDHDKKLKNCSYADKDFKKMKVTIQDMINER